MKRRFIVLAVLTSSVFLKERCFAAEEQIAKCWNLSEEKRDSGVTADMREGSNASIECLKEVLLKRLKTEIEGGEEEEAEVKGLVENMTASLGKISWKIHNERKSCKGHCGTMYHLTYSGVVSDLLEKLIREFDELKEEG